MDAASWTKTMRRPSGATSKCAAHGSALGSSYPVPSKRSVMRPLSRSSTSRCGTRPIGSPRSKWRYCASEVTYALSLRSVNALWRAACALAPFASGHTHDMNTMRLSVGHPLEVVDAGREVAPAFGLAARGGDHVELALAVLAALLLALGEECDAVTARRPRGIAILLAAGGEAARLARGRGQEPEAAARLVLVHRVARDRADGRGPVGRELDVRDAVQLPQGFDVERM